MPGFDAIIGQQLPIRLLQTFISKGAVPHALLFTGIQGIGKRTTAKTFAMALNCMAGKDGKPAQTDATAGSAIPCGQCHVCKQILADSHPDVLLIEPQGAYLRIEQIRSLLGTLAMKPFNADHRMVIIANAQAMNQEAGNALLKVLEEPPSNTIIVLTANQKSDLLPTIVSRCRHIQFYPIARPQLAAQLTKTRQIETEQAEMIAELANGSFSEALRLLELPWKEQRDWLVNAAGLDHPEKLDRRPAALALSFANHLAAQKDTINQQLDMLKTWIRDLSIVPFEPGRIVNRDRTEQLQRLRSHLNDHYLWCLWELLEKAQKDIATNANLRLTLDVMALKMITIDSNAA